MKIVDSHCHVSPHWFEPLEALVFQMDVAGVAEAVLVQETGNHDNSYLFECARRHPRRFALVVVVDRTRLDVEAEVARLARAGASGIRLRANARSPGSDPFAIWRAAGRHGLSISCGGRRADYLQADFLAALDIVGSTAVVLEHLGAGNHPDPSDDADARAAVFELASRPNIFVKFHGLGEFCVREGPYARSHPFARPLPPLLDKAREAFGPERMMWGSDYPPVSGREGYLNALRWPMAELAQNSSAEDLSAMFGGVARLVFPIKM